LGIRTDDAAYFRQTKKLNMAKNAKKAGAGKATAKQPKKGKAKGGSASKPGKGNNAGRIIMTTVAMSVAGIAGYFGWQYLKKRKASRADAGITITDMDVVVPDKPTKPIKEPPVTKQGWTKSTNDDFPLRKGSKGERVRILQQAIIDKYGSSALPKYGADGDFGTETATALKKQGIPNPVTESAYNLLAQSGSNIDSTALARQLHTAANNKNYDTTLNLLKNLKNKQDYQAVSNSFLPLRLRGVRQTLVNGLLSSFSNAAQKHAIGMEFIRMGLQFAGGKYSLSGFGGKPVVTIEPATIWVSATQTLQVPASMVLGNEVGRRLDYTLFENNEKYFLIKTQSIKYL
jgi:hypothetical protein